MNRLTSLSLILVLVFSSGCFHWNKKSTPKPNPSIAGETEENLRQRFVEKRAGELVAQGVAAEAARGRAEEEFKARYGYTNAARK